ncbi:sensor histidine kinase [Bacteroides sp. 224]|uniref:sensor histidine kinase n=1 Tax=Bacteroides sp. 224 TaxID=2302936 RepID=UPI0013D4587D|nr:histidine kinase [Bacteroides sp. 224]NDV63748.1 hypothetical protein [Bacteroides sp. 224]
MRHIILFLFVFVPLLLSATPKEYKNIHSLEKGDWLMIESAEYYPYQAPGMEKEVPWRAENIRRVVLKATVLYKQNETVTLGFSIESIYDCRNYAEKDSMVYYDSRYIKDFLSVLDNDKLWLLPMGEVSNKDIIASLTYNIKDGTVIDSHLRYKDLYCRYQRVWLPLGLREEVKSYRRKTDTGMVNIHRTVFEDIPQLLRSQTGGKSITTPVQKAAEKSSNRVYSSKFLLDLPKDISHNLLSRQIRVVAASFSLPPNVKLTYTKLARWADNTKVEQQELFIPAPQYYMIDSDLRRPKTNVWLISPGDSIVRIKNEDGTIQYSGRGSIQNEFFNLCVEKIYFKSIEDDWRKEYQDILNQYNNDLPSYWNRLFNLDKMYLESSNKLSQYASSKIYTQPEFAEIDWEAPYFTSLIPLTDASYFMSGHFSFLNSYIKYKKVQISSETLNSINFRPKLLKEEYYQNKLFLAGQPLRNYNVAIVERLMMDNMLMDIQQEYNDFIATCPDTVLTNRLERTYQKLNKLEKGKKIQQTDLRLAKLAQDKNTREYLLLQVGVKFSDYDIGLEMCEKLKNGSLKDKVTLHSYVSEEVELKHYDNTNEYWTKLRESITTILSLGEIERELSMFGNVNRYTILMRKDGTILYRLGGNLLMDEDLFIDIIERDLNRTRSDFWTGFRNGLLITIAFSLVAIFIISVRLSSKRKREKRERQIKELELKAIRSQMNPHFIFNAMSSIQNLINRGGNKEADEYLVRFSRLLRMVLNNSEKKLVPLSEEIEQLYLYLDIEQLRVPFQYRIEVDEQIETDLVEIPGMLIQPFIENAVKHAIAPRGEGEIVISMKLLDDKLVVTITDDGSGIIVDKGNGFAVKAITEEIEILKTLHHREIGVDIENRQEKESVTGCKVTLYIPIG